MPSEQICIHFEKKQEQIILFLSKQNLSDTKTINIKDIKNNEIATWKFQDGLKKCDECSQCSEAEPHFKKEAKNLTMREGSFTNGVYFS